MAHRCSRCVRDSSHIYYIYILYGYLRELEHAWTRWAFTVHDLQDSLAVTPQRRVIASDVRLVIFDFSTDVYKVVARIVQ